MDLQAGKQLNEDQQQAVANYDRVLGNLEVVRELNQQFGVILAEHNKFMKKQAKREQIERQQEEISKVKDILKFQVSCHCERSDIVSFCQGTLLAYLLPVPVDCKVNWNNVREDKLSAYNVQYCGKIILPSK